MIKLVPGPYRTARSTPCPINYKLATIKRTISGSGRKPTSSASSMDADAVGPITGPAFKLSVGYDPVVISQSSECLADRLILFTDTLLVLVEHSRVATSGLISHVPFNFYPQVPGLMVNNLTFRVPLDHSGEVEDLRLVLNSQVSEPWKTY